jgi:voltage-gated potassium channel
LNTFVDFLNDVGKELCMPPLEDCTSHQRIQMASKVRAPGVAEVRSPAYQIFMLVLCFLALGALSAQVMLQLDPSTRMILDYADNVICAAFLLDFFLSLYRAPDRWGYLSTWGWIDLLSSIPTVDVARWGRAARVVRIFRVLRGIRTTKLLASLVLQRRGESVLLASSLVGMFLVVAASIAILQFEVPAEGNIQSAEDAIWWSFATITTVGYGDRYPVTTEGRLIAATLMLGGVGLFGSYSAFLAAWFLAPEAAEEIRELDSLNAEIREIRQLLERRGEAG